MLNRKKKEFNMSIINISKFSNIVENILLIIFLKPKLLNIFKIKLIVSFKAKKFTHIILFCLIDTHKIPLNNLKKKFFDVYKFK